MFDEAITRMADGQMGLHLESGQPLGRTGRRAEVELDGGRLQVEWAADNHVFMTGPAITILGTWLCFVTHTETSPLMFGNTAELT